jgi:hypothetical protein
VAAFARTRGAWDQVQTHATVVPLNISVPLSRDMASPSPPCSMNVIKPPDRGNFVTRCNTIIRKDFAMPSHHLPRDLLYELRKPLCVVFVCFFVGNQRKSSHKLNLLGFASAFGMHPAPACCMATKLIPGNAVGRTQIYALGLFGLFTHLRPDRASRRAVTGRCLFVCFVCNRKYLLTVWPRLKMDENRRACSVLCSDTSTYTTYIHRGRCRELRPVTTIKRGCGGRGGNKRILCAGFCEENASLAYLAGI